MTDSPFSSLVSPHRQKCEHVLLVLLCEPYSSALYQAGEVRIFHVRFASARTSIVEGFVCTLIWVIDWILHLVSSFSHLTARLASAS